jgi:hypothetical protein
MGFSDVDSATCDYGIAVVTHGKLTSALEVKSNPAFDVFFSFVSLRLGLHCHCSTWQCCQLRPKLHECGLQCRKLRENKGGVCCQGCGFGVGTWIDTDTKLACGWAGSQERQI